MSQSNQITAHVIWKFPLELTDVQTIELPQGAECRLVAEQNGVLTVWFEVDPEKEKEERTIAVVGTGRPFQAGIMHLGSAVCGEFVWHVYMAPNFGDLCMRLAGLK